ncbi:MAG: zinc-ribbon domain-containing protein [Oscillospiraceae bacterium]|nr:zinc-ribbon domain-containing protein [Oscillospiraceae bacterium]
MFCTNCGTRLEEGSRFCTKCGEPAAQVLTAAELNPAQKALLVDTQSRQRKGHKLGKAALILGIIAIVLSLAFAPFIYKIFSRLDMTMTSEEWVIAIFTVFIYLAIKVLALLAEGLATASLFIVPCLLIQLTGLTLAIVGRAGFKDKKLATPAIFVNAGGLLLQVIIISICVHASGTIPIN